MKINLAHLLRQSAEAIAPKRDRAAYAFMLNEVADHIDQVKCGEHSLAEFAEYYCITPENEAAS